ncbi:hypothetical protein HY498_00365 [Candidatus Woesearchaeota archaeon]|nr:hypothetical protein [Candidatus Woesearchaeota archaeon]
MTELKKEEKELIRKVLKKHLEEIHRNEKLTEDLRLLAAEVKYDDFVENIIKKLTQI